MSAENWQNFARQTAGKIITKICGARYHGVDAVKELEPPYLIVGNHTTVADPFLLSIGLNQTVYFVTSDLYFRTPLLRFLAKKAGCIPKAKSVSEFRLIKTLTEHVSQNHCIGLYPEGYRIWDGETDRIPRSTAKLIKLLKIPVVAVTTKGGYMAMPRWGRHNRRGQIDLYYNMILSQADTAEKTANEIFDIVFAALIHNEYINQRSHMAEYKGRKLAETLELLLYCCPCCHRFETMVSAGKRFYCEACGYGVKLNKYGFFDGESVLFDNVRDWREFCDNQLAFQLTFNPLADIYKQRKVTLLCEKKRYGAFSFFMKGIAEMRADAFVLRSSKQFFAFTFANISGLTVSKKNAIDFYFGEKKYRIKPVSSKQSAVFWEQGYQLLSKKDEPMNE